MGSSRLAMLSFLAAWAAACTVVQERPTDTAPQPDPPQVSTNLAPAIAMPELDSGSDAITENVPDEADGGAP